MTKKLKPFILVISSPLLIIIFCVFSVKLYYFLIEPIFIEYYYAANRNKECSESAKFIRFIVGDTKFKVPASHFRRASLRQCWGNRYLTGGNRVCTKNYQSQRNKNSVYSGSFCQADEDPAFILDKHQFELKNGYIRFDKLTHDGSLRRFCRNAKSVSGEDVSFYGNYVSVGCYAQEGKNVFSRCTFSTYVGSDTRVFGKLKFDKEKVSLEEKRKYFQELENFFESLITNVETNTAIEMCKNYD